MYAKEKGITVFAIYSKDNPDDPTVLYAAKGENAEKKHKKLLSYMEEYNEHEYVREDLDRVFETLESQQGHGGSRLSVNGNGQADDGNVPVFEQKPGSNGVGDFGTSREDLKNGVTKYSIQASEKSDASSFSDNSGKTLSKGQQEYFKDSKFRDENGNLKIMYRGDAEDISVFDRKKSSCSNLYRLQDRLKEGML